MSRRHADRCRIPPAFWRAASRAGMQPEAILRQARLPAALHLAEDAWLTVEQYCALWRAVETLSGDPAIGITMSLATDVAGHPPATMSAFFARDYRDALARLARYKRLCTPEELEVVEEGTECVVSFDWAIAVDDEPDAIVDVTLAAILELGRRGTGSQIMPRRVELTRKGPVHGALTDYISAPVLCGRSRNLIVLSSADLDRPFAAYNPEMLAVLAPALANSLTEMKAQSSIADQVKVVIKRRLASGKPDVEEIARELGTSERTLQRRIANGGTTFRRLLDEARHEIGQQMLASGANGIDEIAFLLGYQDTSSFYRAFRSWEGVTPAQWRSVN